MNSQIHKIEEVIQSCNQLLDEEEAALDAKNLEKFEKVVLEKQEVIAELVGLLDDPENHPFEDDTLEARAQAVLDRIQANDDVLSRWMDHQQKEIAIVSRKKLNLRGVKKKYVTEHQGYLRRSKSFKA